MSVWILAFVAFVAAVAGVHYYVFRRLASTLALERRGRRRLGWTLLAPLVLVIVGRSLARGGVDDSVAAPIAALGALGALAVVVTFATLLGRDAVALVVARIRSAAARRRRPKGADVTSPRASAVSDAAPEPPTTEGIDDVGRRAFLARATVLATPLVGVSTSAYGSLFGRVDYDRTEVPLALERLPRALDGYRISQLSDIHFGLFVGEDRLRAAVSLLRDVRPDLVVLTGDLVDHDPRYAALLGQLIRQTMPLTRDGVAVIAGNHEYYAGIDTVLASAKRAGARVLVNEGITIGDAGGAFGLLGVDDVLSRREGPVVEKALADVHGDLATILLCHNPSYFSYAASRVNAQISGHTHGGQVNLVLRPADLVLPHGYVAGRYERDGSVLYVNRGFGTAGPPARVQAPPEVTTFVLHRG